MSSFKYNPFTNNLDEVGGGDGGLVVSTINDVEPDENGNFSITGSGIATVTETLNGINIDVESPAVTGIQTINEVSPDVDGDFSVTGTGSAVVTETVNGINIDVTASTIPSSTNTYWFSSYGSDANDGKSIATPFLNLSTAITAASGQSPMWTVQCADSSSVGTFASPASISIPAGITIYAPSSDLNANITLTGTGTINLTCRNILAGTGDLITLSNQTFNLTAKILLGSPTIKCLTMSGAGIVTLNTQSMQSTSGTVINIGSGGQVNGFTGLVVGDISNNLGTVNLVCAQAVVTKSGNNPQNVNVITSNSFSQIASMVLDPSGTISTSKLATNSFSLGAWDVDGAAYASFITFKAGDTPSMQINTPAGSSGTLNNTAIGGTTAAAGAFTTLSANGDFSLTGDQVQAGEGGTGLSSYTKGDLIAASGTSTLVKRTAGTDGQMLVADSTQDSGLNYANQSLRLISSQTASNSADLQFTNLSGNYLLTYRSVVPATDAAVLCFQTSTDNGSSWNSSGYVGGLNYSAYNTIGTSNLTAGARVLLSSAVDNATSSIKAQGVSGQAFIYNMNTSLLPMALTNAAYPGNQSDLLYFSSGTGLGPNTLSNALRVLFDSGNITSGTVSLYKLG